MNGALRPVDIKGHIGREEFRTNQQQQQQTDITNKDHKRPQNAKRKQSTDRATPTNLKTPNDKFQYDKKVRQNITKCTTHDTERPGVPTCPKAQNWMNE